jgi:type IV secretory pathway VirB4 component
MRVRSLHPAHRYTTAHLQSAYPFLAASGDWAPGVYIGEDICGGGGAFCYDPWELYARGLLTNPNLAVIGQVGRGKSATVKAYAARSLVFGRRVIALDRKGELARLCEAARTQPIRLERGGPVRLNPLDARLSVSAGLTDREMRQDQMDVLIALGGAACRRALTSSEKAALRVALTRARREAAERHPTLADVSRALLTPADDDAAALAMSARELAEGSRDVALEFDRLVSGDLAGMFDGPTTDGIDLTHQLVVFDLSAVYQNDDMLGVLMVCVAAWVQRLLQRDGGPTRSILVLEEAWSCLSSVEVARWMRNLQKLSRQYGVQVVMVLHRFSDLLATGAEGSEVVSITRGLLSDSETHVIHGMPEAEVDATRDLLGLSETEAAILPELPRGRALWRVRGRSFVVDLRLSRLEEWICDTDARMTAGLMPDRGAVA